jgi:hypothetical protein
LDLRGLCFRKEETSVVVDAADRTLGDIHAVHLFGRVVGQYCFAQHTAVLDLIDRPGELRLEPVAVASQADLAAFDAAIEPYTRYTPLFSHSIMRARPVYSPLPCLLVSRVFIKPAHHARHHVIELDARDSSCDLVCLRVVR